VCAVRAKIQRAHEGSRAFNRLLLRPTFCIVEFLDNSDSKMVKRRWESFGFRDVTPRLGNPRSEVITFKEDKYARQWDTFQAQLGKVQADWYYLSGHHASQFWNSINLDNQGKPFHDFSDFYQNQEEIGFFNEHYHHGRWQWHSTQPDRPINTNPLEIYMSSTDRHSKGLIQPQWGGEPAFQKSPGNPLLGDIIDPYCLGLLLIGCNTLSYRETRRSLSRRFPEAVIIGLVGSKNSADSTPLIQRIFKTCNRNWFSRPQTDPAHPDQPLDPLELARRLNHPVGKFLYALQDILGVVYKGKYYFPNVRKINDKKAVIEEYVGVDINKSWYGVWGR
jgi:hypothetical protein